MTYATLEAPQTCTRCGITEGNPVSFELIVAPDGYDKNYLRGDAWVCVNDGDASAKLSFLTADGEVKGDTVELSKEDAWSYSIQKNAVFISYGDYPSAQIKIYDLDGECRIETSADYWDAFDEGYPVTTMDGNGIVKLYNNGSGEALLYFDSAAFEIVDAASYTEDNSAYGHEGWYYYKEQANGLIMVGSEDRSEWGYLDADGDVLAMYADASDFTASGYALVSADRENYDLIDSELNVVAEKIVSGISASLYTFGGGNVLSVTHGDGSYAYYIVE